MTIVLVLALLVAIALATYLSSLNLSLMGLSRAALQHRLTELGRPAEADWLYDQRDSAMLATALFRTLGRMTIYVLLVGLVIGLRDVASVTWLNLIVSGLIAAAIIWFTTIVLSTSIARHCGTSLIAANLPVLRIVTWLCRPLTGAGAMVDQVFRTMLGARGKHQAEAEFLQTIEDSHREGALDIQSAEILENVVEFTNTEVSQVMTPRTEIEGIEFTNDFGSIREFIRHAGHSRIPVYRGNVDNIIGILYLKDLIKYLGEDATDFKLAALLRQPIVVPETKPVRELLSVFQHSEVHMAIVIDEYGGTAGLVTIEDVLEEIVGNIRDEHEPAEVDGPIFKSIDETHAEVDGRFRIDELNEQLRLDLPEDGEFDTLAGFMLWQFGRVPAQGEAFESHNARFTALAATPTAVQRIGVELLRPPKTNGEPAQQQSQAVK